MQLNFVDTIPSEIKDGIVYVSIPYGTVIHNCACGCGNEVNTPLSPTGWKFIYNGKSMSLEPSIGNWSFDCKSHYWIRDNEIEWALTWSDSKIKSIRMEQDKERAKYYENQKFSKVSRTPTEPDKKPTSKKWWLWKFIFGD